MNIWFVCQGDTFNAEQGQRYLYAAYRAANGRLLFHWDNVRRVRPGDIIVNYAASAIRGISIAKDSQPEADGTKVNIDFFPFEPPLPFATDLAVELREVTPTSGPIAADNRTKQGYLFDFSLEGIQTIQKRLRTDLPEPVLTRLADTGLEFTDYRELPPVPTVRSLPGLPLNSILYGPPGTGKTYNSIERAVAIIRGSTAASHQEIKSDFDELEDKGQIEFVTFHQNYSYEDFIVGIRPDVDNEELRFQAQKGIFYRIARRARENWEESIAGKGKRSFEEVLGELLEPLQRHEPVSISMASGIYFRITEVSDRSLSFTKQSGGKDHTLSISTLRDLVERVRDVPSGLDSYYKPLVKLLQNKQITAQPADDLKNFVLIIDEINRANISRVFGELITLLENDKRLGSDNELKLTLPNGEKDFGVPPNLYIVGTMNTADKSIALIDIALRRRFEFIGFYPRYDLVDQESSRLLREINAQVYLAKKSADYLVGHAYFMDGNPIEATLRNKIIPLLMEYLAGKTAAVERVFEQTDWRIAFNEESFTWDIEAK